MATRTLTAQEVEHAEDEVARIIYGRGFGRATDAEMSTAARVVEAVLRRTRITEAPDAR